MNDFLKFAALVLIAVLLYLNTAKHNKEISVLIIVAAVCIIICSAATLYIQPIIDFVHRMQSLGKLDSQMTTILLKATGIGFLSEIVNLICNDAGNAALGKTLKMICVFVILCLSLPLLNNLLNLIDTILSTL